MKLSEMMSRCADLEAEYGDIDIHMETHDGRCFEVMNAEYDPDTGNVFVTPGAEL